MCDIRVSARMKGKVYKTVVMTAMLYGLDIVPMRNRQKAELEVAERKMWGLSFGVTRIDKIGNSTSERQFILDVLGMRPGRQD